MEEKLGARGSSKRYYPPSCPLLPLIVCCAAVMVTPVGGGCPFQNPFWFVDRPRVEAVTAVAEGFLPRVRLMWGRIENFKCVDYFYVEYFQRRDPAGTVRRSARISRDRRSLEIEVRSQLSAKMILFLSQWLFKNRSFFIIVFSKY